METPSPARETSETQIETPNVGNMTLTNSNVFVSENLEDCSSENQLTEPCEIINEIQVRKKINEQKNNDRDDRDIKMREEMGIMLETIFKEIRANKNTSIVTNARSEPKETQSMQPTRSKPDKSIGFDASNNVNSDQENEDYPPKASEIRELRTSRLVTVQD